MRKMKIVIISVVLFLIIAPLIGLIVTGKSIGWGPFAFLKYNYEEVYKLCDKTYSYSISDFEIETGDGTIRGKSYLPKGEETFDALIFSHGYATTMKSVYNYCKVMAKCGIACFAFDFRGGSNESSSDKTTKEMSVLTEASDLNNVIDYVKTIPFVNVERISLIGFSFGGLVSTIVSSERSDIYRLILEYPAYVALRKVQNEYSSNDDLPEESSFNGTRIGRIYYEDMLKVDLDETIREIDIKTLIMHGTADESVSYQDSVDIVGSFKDARLILLNNQPHGFIGKGESDSYIYMYKWLKNIEI